MCQRKPGLRCSKHARQQIDKTFKFLTKARKHQDNSLESAKLVKQAELSHEYSTDLYKASPIMFKTLLQTNKEYKTLNYLNKAYKAALKHEGDTTPGPLQIGNTVKTNNHGVFKKTSESSKTVVKASEKTFVIWDSENPYHLDTYSRETNQLQNSQPLDNPDLAYGYEFNKKPDIRWAIWYTGKHLNIKDKKVEN